MIASQRSIGNSRTGAVCWMPALLTRISTPPRSRRMRDHVVDFGGLRHVGGTVGHAHAVRFGERSPHPVDLGRLAKLVQEDVGTCRRQRLGDPEADAASSTRSPLRTGSLSSPGANGRGRRSVETETFMRSLLPVDHRHEHRGQGPTPAQQTLGPPIKGPGGNAERHGKEDRVQERHQDQDATDDQDQQQRKAERFLDVRRLLGGGRSFPGVFDIV